MLRHLRQSTILEDDRVSSGIRGRSGPGDDQYVHVVPTSNAIAELHE